jgi:predicted DNA-binding transcriptional regulator YafY
MPRASHIQKAERINLARTLLQQYQHWPQATQRLARSCSISERQAYR